jgi:hypothetical protein
MAYAPVLFLCIVVTPFIRAFVLKTMWGWFMVPLFGLPSLGMVAAYGLALTVFAFLPRDLSIDSEYRPKDAAEKLIRNTVVSPFVILGLGWIAHGCM